MEEHVLITVGKIAGIDGFVDGKRVSFYTNSFLEVNGQHYAGSNHIPVGIFPIPCD